MFFSKPPDENELKLKPLIHVEGTPDVRFSIEEKMQQYQIPGISIAVIDEGKVVSAKNYGIMASDSKQYSVNYETLFQAASISKPITALAALLLVENGDLELDTPVNKYLKNWKIKTKDLTEDDTVTLRMLLSHKAGLNLSGFAEGYARDQPFPTTEQILNGEKPLVTTDPILVNAPPGSETIYSGGGYTVIQLLIEQIAKEQQPSLTFAEWMKKNVLDKLGMQHSTFEQPQPNAHNIARGHNGNNLIDPKGWRVYPGAAGGLWSTASDLAKAIVAIQNCLTGKDNTFLKQATVREMLTPQGGLFGLGPQVSMENDNIVFDHGGSNFGYRTYWCGVGEGKGLVIMTNSDAGAKLIPEIKSAVAEAYGWPESLISQPIEVKLGPKTPEVYKSLEGHYAWPGNNEPAKVIFNDADNKLMFIFGGNRPPIELFQEATSDGKISFLNLDGGGDRVSFNIDPETKQLNSLTISKLDGKISENLKKLGPPVIIEKVVLHNKL